jgi:hypothetical protein
MDASLLIGLPIAVWALILLGYAFVRIRRDRIEHRKTFRTEREQSR